MIGVAYALIAIGGVTSLLNWSTLIVSVRGEHHVSTIPLVGAVLLGCGLALHPEMRAFAWLAPIADYGTLVDVIALPRIASEIWLTSHINLLHCLINSASGRDLTIRLFRHRVALISATFDPPAPCNEYDARVKSFELVGRWVPTASGFSIEGYDADRQLLVSKVNGAYTTEELNYPSDRRYTYDCLDGLVVQEKA